METLDDILKKIKKTHGEEAKTNFENFRSHLCVLLANQHRGHGVEFQRVPGSGTTGELNFRNKLFWLKTLPLENGEAFIVLHPEAAGYYEEKKSKYSADLLGLWRAGKTTRFAVAELKAGKNGDPVLYAVAEGLRNLFFLWQERTKLGALWMKYMKKCVQDEVVPENVWGRGHPFAEFDMKNLCLLIIGDESWRKSQSACMDDVPREVKLGNLNVKVAVYSTPPRAKAQSKPHILLPLRNCIDKG